MSCSIQPLDFKINGSDKFFGSDIYAFDATFSFSNSPSEFSISCINQNNTFDTSSILNNSIYTITLGGERIKIRPVEYQVDTSPGGIKTLKVNFVDLSYKYLDKYIVLIKDKHVGKVYNKTEGHWKGEYPTNLEDFYILVGQKYFTITIKDYDPIVFCIGTDGKVGVLNAITNKVDIDLIIGHPWIQKQYDGLIKAKYTDIQAKTIISNWLKSRVWNKPGEFFYTFKDLLDVLEKKGIPFDKTLLDLQAAKLVQSSHCGPLRDVLGNWGSDLGILFYWDSTSGTADGELKFISINEHKVSHSTIQSMSISDPCISSISESASIRETFGKGVVGNYIRDEAEEDTYSEMSDTKADKTRKIKICDFNKLLMSKDVFTVAPCLYLSNSTINGSSSNSFGLNVKLFLEQEKESDGGTKKFAQAATKLGLSPDDIIKELEEIEISENMFKSACIASGFSKINAPAYSSNLKAYNSSPEDHPSLQSFEAACSMISNLVGSYFIKEGSTTFRNYSQYNFQIPGIKSSSINFIPAEILASEVFGTHLIELCKTLGICEKNDSFLNFINKTCSNINLNIPNDLFLTGKKLSDLTVDKNDAGDSILPPYTRGFILCQIEPNIGDSNINPDGGAISPQQIKNGLLQCGSPVEFNIINEEGDSIALFIVNKEKIQTAMASLAGFWASYKAFMSNIDAHLEFFNTDSGGGAGSGVYGDDSSDIPLPDSFFKRSLQKNDDVLQYLVEFLDFGPIGAFKSDSYINYLSSFDDAKNYTKTFELSGLNYISTGSNLPSIKNGLSSLSINFSQNIPTVTITFSSRKAFTYMESIFTRISYGQRAVSNPKIINKSEPNHSLLSSFTKNFYFRHR